MYRTSSGEEIFVVDGHTHFWDAAPANQRNIHGRQFIDCFYAYHTSLSPEAEVWPKEKFEKYDVETMYRDLFVDGPADMAIIQPAYLKDFYINGFNTTEQNAVIAQKYPDRFILNGAFDPRDGALALEQIHALKEAYGIRGVKLYTAEWRGASRGWRLNDADAYRCFELCETLGITNIHVHKGPTITPLAKDAFDCHDVDHAATMRRPTFRTSPSSSSMSGCRASTIFAGSRYRRRMSGAASRWRCRSCMRARAISRK